MLRKDLFFHRLPYAQSLQTEHLHVHKDFMIPFDDFSFIFPQFDAMKRLTDACACQIRSESRSINHGVLADKDR